MIQVPPAPSPVVQRLPDLLDHAAGRIGGLPFLLRWTPDGWSGYSFAEAARAAHAFAHGLSAAGVGPRTRVGLLAENRPEWGLAYLAVQETGAVVVPLDIQLTSHEVGEILRAAEAAFCIVSARTRAVVAEACGERIALVDLDLDTGAPSWPDAQRRFAGAAAVAPPKASEDLAALIFTSGTTGRPKGVMLSHSNLLHNVEAVAQTFEFGPADRFLSVLPLHHTFECTGGMLAALRVGASVAYARGLKPNELREDLASSKATLLLGVPLLYEKLLAGFRRGVARAPLPQRAMVLGLLGVTRLARWVTGARIGGALLRSLRERAGLSRLRLFVSGAAPLPADVFWDFADLGFPILEGYGLTECAPVVAANHPSRSKPGAVGWPLPGVEVRIEDPDEEGNGEVLVRGPNLMLGYHRDPTLTAEVLRGGWFHTGDVGRFLGDGRLKITGRLKNMIASAAGKKIYPEEVELRLASCPYVVEVVVLGGRDASGGREEVHAHVFPDFVGLQRLAQSQGRSCDTAFVESVLRQEIETCCQTLAPYKRVRRVIVRREEFPKTTTGKIRREGTLGSDADAGRRSAVA